jgi:protein required for attachment to host cells
VGKFPLTWVVVADSARARIFVWRQANGELNELQDLTNSEARLPNRELASGEPGRAVDAGGHHGGHPMTQAQSPREKASQNFARDIAKLMKHACDAHDFERAVLIAPAGFLGSLKGCLDKTTAKRVKATLTNDLTKATPADIQAHLPEPWALR